MALNTNGCGNQIYIPDIESCDECDQFEARIERAENDIDSLESSLANKQDKLTAGDNITIEGNEISANLSSKQDKLRLIEPELEFTVTEGVLVDYWVRQYGPMVFLSLEVDNENTVASGGNYFVATLDTQDLLPVATVTSGSFMTNHSLDGLLKPFDPPHGGVSGQIIIRNASSSSIPPNSAVGADAVMSFSYIINSVPDPALVDYAIVG